MHPDAAYTFRTSICSGTCVALVLSCNSKRAMNPLPDTRISIFRAIKKSSVEKAGGSSQIKGRKRNESCGPAPAPRTRSTAM
jgi:hypothetical protein